MSIEALVVADSIESGEQLIHGVLAAAGIHARLDNGSTSAADVIIVDVSQLRGAPLAGLRALRERGDSAPAILVASRLTEQMAADVFRLGIREFIIKPLDPSALVAAVRAHASNHAETLSNTEQLTDQTRLPNEALRRRMEEAQTVAAIGRAVVQTHDLDVLLKRIVEAATYLTGAEEGGLYLTDPQTNALVLRASKDPGQLHAAGQRIRVEDTIAGEVLRSGTPAIRKRGGTTNSGIRVNTGYFVHALINVPLRGRDRIIGVLGVYNRSIERGFEDRHVELLQSVADWASIAIENARLVRRLEQGSPANGQAPTTPPAEPTRLSPALRDNLLGILQEAEQAFSTSHAGPLDPDILARLTYIRSRAEEMLAQLGWDPHGVVSKSPTQQTLDLGALVESVVEAHRTKAEEKGLSIAADLLSDAPVQVAAPERVRQVMDTLVTNSIRLTPSGSVLITVYPLRVKDRMPEGPFALSTNLSLPDGDWMAVAISDSGPGLPPAELASLTQALPSEVPAEFGLGISLGAARMITEMQGGQLWVEGPSPEGSPFTVTMALPSG